jgi:sec-independent protein translocase protein TatC
MTLPDAASSSAGHLSGHLKELRDRLAIALVALVLCSSVAYFYVEKIADFFMRPLFHSSPELGHLVYTNLTDAFISYIKIAILVGFAASFPVCIYQGWMYIAPGLRRNEKRFAVQVVFFGSSLFAGGVLFAFFIVLPRLLSFFMHFSSENLTPLPRFGDYLTFIARTCLAFGLAFEIPFLMIMAGKSGLVSSRYFSRKRKYFYGAIAVLAFLLTAGDPFSTVLLAVPLFLLYESGVAVSRLF